MAFVSSKLLVFLIIGLILSLIIVVLTGRILYDINKSSSKNDVRIQNARKWATWGVGVSTVAMILCLIGLISILFI